MRILVVEDEHRMASLLEQGLTEEGHHVHIAMDGEQGLSIAQSASFDAIILDVMLPRRDGLSVVRALRQNASRTPILMLTARDGIADVVRGLDTGADDYLIKPFSFEVLLARLRAVSRRGPIARSVCYQVADLRMDTSTRCVSRSGQVLNLTPTEHNLLEVLMVNAGRPVSRDAILDHVWGFEGDVHENTVEAFIRLLRHKVDAPFETKLIHTVRGVGYCLREPEHSSGSVK